MRKAFTLIETMVSIGLLGVLATVMSNFVIVASGSANRAHNFVSNEISITSLIEEFKAVENEDDFNNLREKYEVYFENAEAAEVQYPNAKLECVDEISSDCYALRIGKSPHGGRDVVVVHDLRVK